MEPRDLSFNNTPRPALSWRGCSCGTTLTPTTQRMGRRCGRDRCGDWSPFWSLFETVNRVGGLSLKLCQMRSGVVAQIETRQAQNRRFTRTAQLWESLGLSTIHKTTSQFFPVPGSHSPWQVKAMITEKMKVEALRNLVEICFARDPSLGIRGYMEVSINGGIPKRMVYNGKSHKNGWFRGIPTYGNHHTSSTRTRRGGSCLRFDYKTFFVYRTCMRRAPVRQPDPYVRALYELVALLLSKNMPCMRPCCNATSSEHFLHTSHCICTPRTSHFTLRTSLHSSSHLILSHLIWALLALSHLISALLISSHLFSCVLQVGRFLTTVFISFEHWSTFLISSKFFLVHLGFYCQKEALCFDKSRALLVLTSTTYLKHSKTKVDQT